VIIVEMSLPYWY